MVNIDRNDQAQDNGGFMVDLDDSLKKWLAASGGQWEALDVILSTVEALILILDPKGTIVYFNRTCEELTGYSLAEVKGRAFFDIFLAPEEKETVKKVFDHLSAGLFPNRYENHWVTKNNDRRLISWSNNVLTSGAGEVAFIVGTGMDITEKRKKMDELKMREEHFRLAADFTYDWEYWHDSKGCLAYMSPACRRITGYEVEEFLEDPGLISRVVHPEDRSRFANHLKQVDNPDLAPMELEFRIVTKDGDQRWITHGCQAVFNDRKDYLGRRAINRDDTVRKRYEESLIESERNAQAKSALLDAINAVLRETLTSDTDEDVARICLEEARKLTGSQFGFIGEINSRGFFDTIALSDPGWGDCQIAEQKAVRLIKNMEIRGLWGSVIKNGVSRSVNDPAAHPDRVGLPEGHPPLLSFLGIPLIFRGNVFGMVAMANKRGGYTPEDQKAMEALSVVFVEALNRKRSESQLLEERRQLLSIFDGINEVVYVADPKTYEILFMNKAVKNYFGEKVGHICHEVFQGKPQPCEFCTNDLIFGEKIGQAHVWEFYNPKADAWFRCIDKAIRWPDGRMVRYELAIDITDSKRAEEAIRRSAISRHLVGEMFRDLQELSELKEGDLFNAGRELAARMATDNLDEFIDTFSAMGLGELKLVSIQETPKRWTFTGTKLMESDTNSPRPTGNYTRGFLCGAVSRVTGAPRVAAVETECQSMGDPFCRFVVQVLA